MKKARLLGMAGLCAGLLLFASDAPSGLGPDWFEYRIPADGNFSGLLALPFAGDGASDAVVGTALGVAGPAAPALGRVAAGSDSHFALPDGSRIRFMGANVADLPPEDKADDEARRLSSLGVNVVRFSRMDADWSENAFGYPDSGQRVELSAEWLKRFDFFRARLAERGVYAHLLLLSERTFSSAEGLPPAVDAVADYQARRDLGFWNKRAMDLEKDFARRLLARKSAETGLPVAEDPSVAFVEISGGKGLASEWMRGALDGMDPSLTEPLRLSWNAFLRARHGDLRSLQRDLSLAPGSEKAILEPAASPLKDFSLERADGAEATLSEGRTPDGLDSVSLKVTTPRAVASAVVLSHPAPVEEGACYRLSLMARADRPRKIVAELSSPDDSAVSAPPRLELQLGPEWKRITAFFPPAADAASDARLRLEGFGDSAGTVEFAALRLSSVVLGLEKGQDPASDGVPLPLASDRGALQEPLLREWFSFLSDQEGKYWKEMSRFLREDLGVKALITGGSAGYSSAYAMDSMDAVDASSYANYPSFTGNPWDPQDLRLRNLSAIRSADGGAITSPALSRVWGKPFSLVEFDEPFPCQYGGEAFPLMAAYASFQDWDGIYSFAYPSAKEDGSDQEKISSLFDQSANPVKLAGFLNAALWFRGQKVAAGREPLSAALSRETEVGLLAGGSAVGLRMPDASSTGLRQKAALARRLGLALDGSAGPSAAKPASAWSYTGGPLSSDTGELSWDAAAGTATLDAPLAKMVSGAGAGRRFSFSGGVAVTQADNPLHASTICVSVVDGALEMSPASVKKVPAARILVTALGGVRNAKDGLRLYGGKPVDIPPPDAEISAGEDLGEGPVLVQGVGAAVEVACAGRKVGAWALLPDGMRGKPLSVRIAGGTATVSVGPEYRSLFYEIELK